MHPLRTPVRTVRLLFALVVTTVLATACAGGSTTDAVGVASLENVAGADEGESTSSESDDATLAADEAALAFSQCLRDEGLDFPDIGVDANGNPDLRDAFETSGIQPGSEEFQAAIDVCGVLLEAAGFGGGGGRAGLAENPEIQDALVAFSDCIRDQGFDVGDLELGGGPGAGGGQAGDGDNPQRGQGAGQGGFGDRTGRFAAALELDPDDPDVQVALDACIPIIDEAFATAGVGPGANNADA